MATDSFIAVDHALCDVGGGAGSLRDAFVLSMVYANAAGRASAKAAAPAEKPNAFYGSWASALGSLGWVVTEASTLRASAAASAEGFTTLETALGSHAAAARAALAVVATRSAPGVSDEALDFWWQHVDDLEGTLLFAFCTLAGDAVANVGLMHVDASALRRPGEGVFGKPRHLDTSTRQALFLRLLPASVNLVSRPLRATLDASVFNAKAAEVRAKLGGKFGDHWRALAPAP